MSLTMDLYDVELRGIDRFGDMNMFAFGFACITLYKHIFEQVHLD